MINVAEVVNDADFAQPFSAIRSQGGQFIAGVWKDKSSTIQLFGITSPGGSGQSTQQTSNADRIDSNRTFYSSSPIYTTGTDGVSDPNTRISDILMWHGEKFRVISVRHYEDFGYYKADTVRMAGE